ncbi:hypothetical protein EYF80_011827 [Liparis tanakae]|uniref:Uncharacterized protein n=1 Tax=Liparis tanakae TaxID=230148 RepID=A0A4Z2IKA3_9TELE|nr:hypothetical protein EYF80_011827 [Liparis tanakae]
MRSEGNTDPYQTSEEGDSGWHDDSLANKNACNLEIPIGPLAYPGRDAEGLNLPEPIHGDRERDLRETRTTKTVCDKAEAPQSERSEIKSEPTELEIIEMTLGADAGPDRGDAEENRLFLETLQNPPELRPTPVPRDPLAPRTPDPWDPSQLPNPVPQDPSALPTPEPQDPSELPTSEPQDRRSCRSLGAVGGRPTPGPVGDASYPCSVSIPAGSSSRFPVPAGFSSPSRSTPEPGPTEPPCPEPGRGSSEFCHDSRRNSCFNKLDQHIKGSDAAHGAPNKSL